MFSVPPTGEVGAGRGGLLDLVEDFGQVLEVVVEARVGVGQVGIAVPAVLGAGAVGDFAAIGWVLGGVEKVLHAIDGVVEEVSVVGTDIDVDLACELRAERGPVALKDGFEIVVLMPVLGNGVVDVTGLFIEDLRRVSIGADWAIDRLPDIELFA